MYVLFFASLLGANMISLDLGFAQLTPFRALVILLFLLFLLDKNVYKFKYNRNNKFVIKKTDYPIYFHCLWLAYAVLSVIWVKSFVLWINGIYFIAIGVMCILLSKRYFKTSTQIVSCLKFIPMMVFFHSLLGWYEIFSGNYMFFDPDAIKASYVYYRLPSSSLGVNGIATFMVLTLPIVYICYSIARNGIEKMFYVILMLSSVALIFKSESRANILGLLLIVCFVCFMSLKSRKLRRIIVVCSLLVIVLIVINPSPINYAWERVQDSINISINETTYMNSDTERWNLLLNGTHFVKETFGLGVGSGNLGYWMQHYAIYDTDGKTAMHNWWMEILSTYGILIFVLYLIYYKRLLSSMLKKYSATNNSMDKSISFGFSCILIGFIITSISSSSIIKYEWLWMLWGIMIVYQGLESLN
jgi:teichuronic acid biosynthesis protein TuaE